jgi:hypothetical protein
MERTLWLAVIVLIVSALLIGAGFLTGMVVLEPREGVVLGDAVEIPKDSLQSCCTFTDGDGKLRTCSVLAPRDCGYCAEYCSSTMSDER